jgi:phosphatidylserine/phosphatidylglycerophosphate/cardiolipin synthase-like enzyme
VQISSENFTATGHATPGQIGNRGWDTAFENREIAAELESIFQTDTSTKNKDIVEIGPDDEIPQKEKDSLFQGSLAFLDQPFVLFRLSATPRPVPTFPQGAGEVDSAKLVTSPHSLESLLSLISSANSTLDIEEMSLPQNWREVSGKDSQLSPLVSALIDAGRRGVTIRVLLNDDSVFSPPGSENPKKPNLQTVQYLKKTAREKKLPISAKIVNIKQVGITYIHNKGIIVDGQRVLISSINGTQNSIMNNREVGIILESQDAAKYFDRAFDLDWAKSGSATTEDEAQ